MKIIIDADIQNPSFKFQIVGSFCILKVLIQKLRLKLKED
jgi:hypothetical protein